MPNESGNEEQRPAATPIETDEQTKKRAVDAAPSPAQGPPADAPNMPLSDQATDVTRIEAATSAAQRLGSDHRTTLVKTLLDMDPDTRKSVALEVGRSLTSERSEEHTSELQSRQYLVCRLLLEKKKK